MLSVLCITYQRHQLLEEAIESYIRNDYRGHSEMVVVNDSPSVEYRFEDLVGDTDKTWFVGGGSKYHKHVRIINHPTRFPNIGRKLEYGFKQCTGEYVTRLDDDDLMIPTALTQIQGFIDADPKADVLRFSNFYQYENNQFTKISEGINTLNTLSRAYINRLEWPDKNADEDLDIVFGKDTIQHTFANTIGMIYRWRGDGTNISSHVNKPNEERLNFMPTPESGTIVLNPHFDNDYYGQLPI